MTMDDFLRRFQRQIGMFPESIEPLETLSPTCCTITIKSQIVFVDLNKRKGFKLSSSVYQFYDNKVDAKIMGSLMAEKKSRKKHAGKVEWDGEKEVLYLQEFPKNLLDDSRRFEFETAFTNYYHALQIVTKRISDIKRGNQVTHLTPYVDELNHEDGSITSRASSKATETTGTDSYTAGFDDSFGQVTGNNKPRLSRIMHVGRKTRNLQGNSCHLEPDSRSSSRKRSKSKSRRNSNFIELEDTESDIGTSLEHLRIG